MLVRGWAKNPKLVRQPRSARIGQFSSVSFPGGDVSKPRVELELHDGKEDESLELDLTEDETRELHEILGNALRSIKERREAAK